MAAEDRAAAAAVVARLYERPHSFHFFQAVRRLECAHPDLPRTGHSVRPEQEPVRFCQEPSLAFAPATIQALRPGEDGRPPRLFVRFLGLTGPNGPMPLHFTEYAREREMDGDHTLARFLDVFNHRMVALFYRAWACNQIAVNFERGRGDRFATYVGSLFGLGMPSLQRRDAVPDAAKLYYSGRLVCRTRHAEGLRAILSEYFGAPCRIAEFFGQWLDLPPGNQCRLGESPATGTLGRTAICGARVWDVQQKFRIVLGPMSLADYRRLLPGGDSLPRLVGWVLNYIGHELTCDVQLILRKEDVPEARLGHFGQLGWTTWLRAKPLDRDADDLVLRPFAS